MAKRKTKRNAPTPKAARGFKIRKNPTVRPAKEVPPPDIDDWVGRMRVRRQPFLFAIARDERTIFANWDIDWGSVFQKVMPADRQVHLRAIGENSIIETRVAVEPMSAMHFLTISGLQNSYRVEIGYFQPFDTWHSVATSAEIEMSPHGSVEFADVDLATIPFHLRFQQLAHLFGVPNDSPIAKAVSEFQKHVLSDDKPNEPTMPQTQILCKLNLSVTEMASAERNFRNIDPAKLARRANAMFRFRGSSPTSGFRGSRQLVISVRRLPLSPRCRATSSSSDTHAYARKV